jgi:hypothetical protein
MPEVKNAFIKSKMNKDLDARLLPSGEYRHAINAQVSRSEGPDEGALENILGNISVVDFAPNVPGLSSIGFLTDEARGLIFVFLTDNEDEQYNDSSTGSKHYIYQYNTNNSTATLLVTGPFLNFSKLYPMTGINILEELLFFTDDRNQPRKINIESAAGGTYYTTEDQISVAKYNPYLPMELYKYNSGSSSTIQYETTMKDVSSVFLPNGGMANVVNWSGLSGEINQLVFPGAYSEPVNGLSVAKLNENGVLTDLHLTVQSYVTATGILTLTGNTLFAATDKVVFVPNPYYDLTYSGDSKFIENKFIRFSYRFKFDDGEYSIFAPFTQPCFIPKQDGYFFDEDQQEAFESSIVSFMENKVNNIELIVPLPSNANSIESNFLIKEIDIISKESDGLAVSVIETIPVSVISEEGTDEYYTYNYTNKKPYKTLPEKDLIRVYDKIPVRALSQEVASNRIIYGNFQTKHTPPAALNYNVAITEKSDFNLKTGVADVDGDYVNATTLSIDNISGPVSGFTPYPGAIVTGNGISGTVIVASFTAPSTLVVNTAISVPNDTVLSFSAQGDIETSTSLVEYPSSSLKTNRQYQVGFVLSDRYGRQSGVILSNSTRSLTVGTETYLGSTVYAPYITGEIAADQWKGQSIKVLFNQLITSGVNSNFSRSTLEPGLYNGDPNSSDYNPLGWYSYKIVVKQQEQEYYNVYTPGALKGVTEGTATTDRETSYISLINDNINKVPRDLAEVGPQDKSFRSSVRLYGRVENRDTTGTPSYSFSVTGNQQFYPEKNSFTVNNIQDLFDLFNYANTTPPVPPQEGIHLFYNNNANPLIGKITTSFNSDLQFGTTTVTTGTPPIYTTIENLAIFETEPVESKLDIFWETTSAGLVAHLNSAYANSSSGAAAFFSSFNTSPFDEDIVGGADILGADFRLVDNFGADIDTSTITSLTLLSVFDREGTPQNVTTYFNLVNDGAFNYNVQTTSGNTDRFIENVYYGDSAARRQFDFTFSAVLTDGGNSTETTITQEAILGNVMPQIFASNGTSPPNGTLGTIGRTTSTILTITGKNGGNSNHSGKDLDWDITSATGSSGNTVSHFSLITSNTNSLSTCQVINNQSQAGIPADNYTIVLRLQDPGGAVDTLTITVSFGNSISTVRRREAILETNNYSTSDVEFVELYFNEGLSTDGYYLYDGTWEELTLTADSSNNIQVDRTGASFTTGGTTTCGSADWGRGSTGAAARDALEECEYDPGTLSAWSYEATVPSSEVNVYSFEII